MFGFLEMLRHIRTGKWDSQTCCQIATARIGWCLQGDGRTGAVTCREGLLLEQAISVQQVCQDRRLHPAAAQELEAAQAAPVMRLDHRRSRLHQRLLPMELCARTKFHFWTQRVSIALLGGALTAMSRGMGTRPTTWRKCGLLAPRPAISV